MNDPPAWIPLALRHWNETLDALETGNLPWLSSRLDSFAKYQFYTDVLNEKRKSWKQLPGDHVLFHELALLDHSYHAFSDAGSVFERLDAAGVLDHRVGPYIAPGGEVSRFVPRLGTRADARAKFIRDHSGNGRYSVDWSVILDLSERRILSLNDPFATNFDEATEPATGSSLLRLRELF